PLALICKISATWLAAPLMIAPTLALEALWILKLAVCEPTLFFIKSLPVVLSKPQAVAACKQTVPVASGKVMTGLVAIVPKLNVPLLVLVLVASTEARKADGTEVRAILLPVLVPSDVNSTVSQLGLPVPPMRTPR